MTERTPSQTVGPYLHIGLMPAQYGFRPVFTATVAAQGQPGEHIRIEGRVFDGEGAVVPDAMIEIWQADAEGRYAHPEDGRPLSSNSFRGFGRASTETGGFAFDTVKPGTVAGPNGTTQAPHISVSVFARGVLKRMHTRIYFPGDGTTIYNWPAWWTTGLAWPGNGENDIAEGLGTMTVNYHSSAGASNQGTVPGI